MSTTSSIRGSSEGSLVSITNLGEEEERISGSSSSASAASSSAESSDDEQSTKAKKKTDSKVGKLALSLPLKKGQIVPASVSLDKNGEIKTHNKERNTQSGEGVVAIANATGQAVEAIAGVYGVVVTAQEWGLTERKKADSDTEKAKERTKQAGIVAKAQMRDSKEKTNQVKQQEKQKTERTKIESRAKIISAVVESSSENPEKMDKILEVLKKHGALKGSK